MKYINYIEEIHKQTTTKTKSTNSLSQQTRDLKQNIKNKLSKIL